MVGRLIAESRRVIADVTASTRKQSVLALMYHSISNDPSDPFAVSSELFRRHMNKLAESGLDVISTSTLLAMIRGERPIVRSICLTFDDGLEDFARTAVPILAEYSYSASLFVTTGLVGSSATWPSWSGPRQFLSWDELQGLPNDRIEIGSHAMSHRPLGALPDDELAGELHQSREQLQKHLDKFLDVIAYPFGDSSPRIANAAREAGYAAAYSVGGLWGNRRNADMYALRRMPILGNTTSEQFASILSGREDWRVALRQYNRVQR